MNHSLSVLKQDINVIESNKKQPSSFGNWFTFPYKDLCLIILADANFGDGRAIQFLKALAEELESDFSHLVTNGSADFDRHHMNRTVRGLVATHGTNDSKLGQAKDTLDAATGQMRQLPPDWRAPGSNTSIQLLGAGAAIFPTGA